MRGWYPGRPTSVAFALANPILNGNYFSLVDQAVHATSLQRCNQAVGEGGIMAQIGNGDLKLPRKVPAEVEVVDQRIDRPHRIVRVDVVHLKTQAPLPETAKELCDVAASLKVDRKDIWLVARASELTIKHLSVAQDATRLANFRIVHFATHGVLAGQLGGTTEPGLILTPPATVAEEDDGYLSAGEIAALKLDADWVILSACNTAGGAGGTGNEEA